MLARRHRSDPASRQRDRSENGGCLRRLAPGDHARRRDRRPGGKSENEVEGAENRSRTLHRRTSIRAPEKSIRRKLSVRRLGHKARTSIANSQPYPIKRHLRQRMSELLSCGVKRRRSDTCPPLFQFPTVNLSFRTSRGSPAAAHESALAFVFRSARLSQKPEPNVLKAESNHAPGRAKQIDRIRNAVPRRPSPWRMSNCFHQEL